MTEPGQSNQGVALPNERDLGELSRDSVVGFAARCAIRVFPMVEIDSFLKDDEKATEEYIRTIDIALMAMTKEESSNNRLISEVLKASLGRVFDAVHPRDAIRAAHAVRAVSLANEAASNPRSGESLAQLACDAAGAALASVYNAARTNIIASTWQDLENLRRWDHLGRPGIQIFQSPLWPSGEPDDWPSRVNKWEDELQAIGLGEVGQRYRRQMYGKGIDLGVVNHQVEGWFKSQVFSDAAQKYFQAIEIESAMDKQGDDSRDAESQVTKEVKKKSPTKTPENKATGKTRLSSAEDLPTTVTDSEELGAGIRATVKKVVKLRGQQKHQGHPPRKETVPTHADEPALTDQLGRATFANTITKRIRTAQADKTTSKNRAFILNLNGPWGSGKSTILNFIEKELYLEPPPDETPWAVIKFNAWQQHDRGPAWWALLNTIYIDGYHYLANPKTPVSLAPLSKQKSPTGFRFAEYFWRFNMRRGYQAAVLLLGVAAIAAIFWAAPDGQWPEHLKNVSGIIAVVGTVIGLLFAMSTRFSDGKEKQAKKFSDATSDIAQNLTTHFKNLITWIHAPVIIMIDDLDRCKEDYVIELLEAIQTLYRHGNVTYIIAADRRWLCASYDNQYQTFAHAVHEPGRPLGYLFVEKIFQLSATIPNLSQKWRTSFWQRLIDPSGTNAAELMDNFKDAVKEAADEMKDLGTEKEILDRVEAKAKEIIEDSNGSAESAQQNLDAEAFRHAAAVLLSTPAAVEEQEHALAVFEPLLDGNPRSMKRLVNAYSIQRTTSLFSEENIPPLEELALWTILIIRWPLLGEALLDHPDWINYFIVENKYADEFNAEKLPEGITPLSELFNNEDVMLVIKGDTSNGTKVEINEALIRRRAMKPPLRSTGSKPHQPSNSAPDSPR